MESHDEERLMYKNLAFGNAASDGSYDVKDLSTALKRNELASTFFYTIPGPKMLWQFGEVGYDFSINYCPNGTINESCRVDPKPIRWNYFQEEDRKRLYDITKQLIHLKINYDVFNTTDYTTSLTGNTKRIHLNSDDLLVTVLGNFNVNVSAITPNFQEAGIWYDYFTGDSLIVSNPSQPIGLQAGEYRLYTNKRLNNPDLPTSTYDPVAQEIEFNAFPNPVLDQLYISYVNDQRVQANISIYNMMGQKVRTILNESQSPGRQEITWNNDLPKGAYLINVRIDGKVFSQKMISGL